MKKTTKKIISLVLAVTMLFSGNLTVHAEDNTTTIVESVTDIYLRTGPGKTYDDLPDAEIHAGDCLRVTDAVVNEYNHIWYRVAYTGGEGYIYENNCVYHTCYYETVYDNSSNPILNICHCGNYEAVNNGYAENMDATVALGSSLLSGEALASLGTLGSTASAAASAAFPYVAVVVVSGMILYMAINSTGTQVGEWELSSESTMDDFESLDNEERPYYKAAAPKESTILYLKVDEPLTIEAANTHLLTYVNNPILTDRNGYYNIYTLYPHDAQELATYFSRNGIGYEYGTSKGPDHTMEVNLDENKQYPQKNMFYHFHVYKRSGADLFKKNKKCHIFFGYPVSYINM